MRSNTKAAFVFLTLSFVLGMGACKDNPKATEACKGESSSDKCNTCCHSNGANGYKYSGGGGCGCLGGGN